MLLGRERYADAEVVLTEALASQRERFGDRSLDTLITFFNVGWIHYYSENYAKALEHFNSAEAGFVELFGEEHRNVLSARRAIGRAHRKLEQWTEAEAITRSNIELSQTLGSPLDHFRALVELGKIQRGTGNPVAAEASLREALTVEVPSRPADHYEHAGVRGELGAVLAEQGRFARGREAAGGEPRDDPLQRCGSRKFARNGARADNRVPRGPWRDGEGGRVPG